MKLALNYICVVGPSDDTSPHPSYYRPFEERFFKTYEAFLPNIEHHRHVTFCGALSNSSSWNLHYYQGGGWDIGAHQKVAPEIDADLIVFLATPVYFWRLGWLERLASAYEQFGPGLYGPMASYENAPHIRTSCFATTPALFATWPVIVDTRAKTSQFESCGKNFSLHLISKGVPVKLVTWDGYYDQPDWRKPANIFRRGDQSNCLVWDRHTDIYFDSIPENKEALSKSSDGL